MDRGVRVLYACVFIVVARSVSVYLRTVWRLNFAWLPISSMGKMHNDDPFEFEVKTVKSTYE